MSNVQLGHWTSAYRDQKCVCDFASQMWSYVKEVVCMLIVINGNWACENVYSGTLSFLFFLCFVTFDSCLIVIFGWNFCNLSVVQTQKIDYQNVADIAHSNLQPLPQLIFSLQEECEKEAMEHFTHVIKICPNRGHIFKNKLQNTWSVILKISAVSRLKFFTFST